MGRSQTKVASPDVRPGREKAGGGSGLAFEIIGKEAPGRIGSADATVPTRLPAGRTGYRPEIDGLRAIAVCLVVLYHAEIRLAGADPFKGGFVGVDVFFVISGYLIGSILFREIAAGSFSFLTFYERRARRILPALYVMLATSIPFAWLFLLPEAFKDWSASLLASVLSLSNVYFWKSGSYDAAENLLRPLIHTWSLGVEEQYYLIFPVLLLVLWRYARRHLPFMMVALCFGSLVLAEWLTDRSASTSFFLLPSRLWELGVGAVLAKHEIDHGRVVSGLSARIMPIAGLCLLALGFLVMRPQYHHPGLMTLLPVIGSALVIWFCGAGDLVTRALSSRPAVFVGMVSYSFYLWHQPVFAFGRLTSIDGVGLGTVLIWIVLAFLLGVATFYLVEVPTRNRRLTSSRSIWLGAVLGAGLLGATGYYGYATNGAGGRFDRELALIASASRVHEADIRQGGKSCLNFDPAQGPCVFKGSSDDGYSLLTLGDSHARTLTGPLLESLSGHPAIASFAPVNRGGCIFVLGMRRVDEDQSSCPDDYNEKRLAYVSSVDRPIAILLSRLPLLVEESRYDNGEGGVEPGDDHPRIAAVGEDGSASPEAVAAAVSGTVTTLLKRGIKVVLVYPIPEMGWNVPQRLLMQARRQGFSPAAAEIPSISVAYADFQRRTRQTYELFDRVDSDPNLVRVYPEQAFCDGLRCFANDGSRIFYRDDNHLSDIGAGKVAGLIMSAIEERWTR
jgi:peptidoglycan/LPS O-acetylase OafA/YrhL